MAVSGEASIKRQKKPTLVFVVLSRAVAKTTSDHWPPTLDFLNHGIAVGKVVHVVEFGEARVSNHAVELFLRLLLLFRVRGHCHDECRDGVGGRIRTSAVHRAGKVYRFLVLELVLRLELEDVAGEAVGIAAFIYI